MIILCKDVKTSAEYDEFCDILFNTMNMGLAETARMIVWNDPSIISPRAFRTLSDYD